MDVPAFLEPSFGEMLELVLSEQLIDQCIVNAQSVVIDRSSERFTMSREEARTFLMGLLLSHWEHTLDLPSGASDRPTAVEVGPAGLTKGTAEASPSSDHQDQLEQLEGRLDRLIAVASSLGIIQDALKEPEQEQVVLVLPDVRARMAYRDAVEYLGTCITDTMPRVGRKSWESSGAY